MRKLNFTSSWILYIVVVLGGCAKDDPGTAIPSDTEKETAIEIPASNTVGALLLDREKAANGYTLFTIHTNTYLVNNCGQVINTWTSDYTEGKAVYLLEDGSILRGGVLENTEVPYPGGGGIVEKISWDNQVLWSYTYSTSTVNLHHDIYPMPNGNVLMLAADKKTEAEAIQAGRDPANITEGVLYNEQVFEVKPVGATGGDIVWEWNYWDHLIQDIDPTKDNYGVLTEHPELMDINYLSEPTNGDADWLHINSLQYNPDLDQILISCNGINEIHIIDHSTTTEEARTNTGGLRGKGGTLLYRWGNPEAYGQGNLADTKLFRQHYPVWIPPSYPDGGKIMLFNNGNSRPEGAYSSIDIIEPPVTGPGEYIEPVTGPYGPSDVSWTYTHPQDPTLFYSRILSSGQRLANGNTLICEGLLGHFFEIDGDEQIVWQYKNPVKTTGEIMAQGDAPEGNLTFRAIKYPRSYPGFSGKDLLPSSPIETDFNIGNCED